MESIKNIFENIRDFIYSWNSSYVGIAVIVIMIAVLVLFIILADNMMKSEQIRQGYQGIIDKNKEAIIKNMKVSKFKAFNYDELTLYISRSGLGYMTNDKMTPLTYTLLRLFLAVFCMIVGFQDSVLLGLILLPIGYFALDFVINISNNSDNTNMLDDIKNVYDTLRIQTKAGVYITSVITDCYLVVQNKRLKKAFLKLTSDIAAKNDLDSALDDFRNKFDNEYLNTLVIIIKQSMKTGQAAKMFEDIRNQITDIEAAMMAAEKVRIQTMITFCQIMLYVSIIAVSIFIAVTSLSTGLAF